MLMSIPPGQYMMVKICEKVMSVLANLVGACTTKVVNACLYLAGLAREIPRLNPG